MKFNFNKYYYQVSPAAVIKPVFLIKLALVAQMLFKKRKLKVFHTHIHTNIYMQNFHRLNKNKNEINVKKKLQSFPHLILVKLLCFVLFLFFF